MIKIRIRLKSPGFENFTGNMGRFAFSEGVSVDELPIRDVMRFGASGYVEDMDGKQLHPSTYQNSHYLPSEIKAEVQPDRSSTAAAIVEIIEQAVEVVEPIKVAAPEIAANVRTYTKGELELEADKGGVEGLRKIAKNFNFKGRSIPELMDGILVAQGKTTQSTLPDAE